jgi:recombinational DNA repair ATPase RecF
MEKKPPQEEPRLMAARLDEVEKLLKQLLAQRQEELRLGHCAVGPPRDEVELQLGGQPARRYGSAGQQRTLVLALKLAELDLVRSVNRFDTILYARAQAFRAQGRI